MSEWRATKDGEPGTKYPVWTVDMEGCPPENRPEARLAIYERGGAWWAPTSGQGSGPVPQIAVTHWRLADEPALPGAELDTDNPLSGDLVTKVDAYLLGVNAMFKVVEMLAKTARGEEPDA